MPLPRGQYTARLFKIKPYPDLLALRQIYTAKSISWFRTVARYSPITSFIFPLSVKKGPFWRLKVACFSPGNLLLVRYRSLIRKNSAALWDVTLLSAAVYCVRVLRKGA